MKPKELRSHLSHPGEPESGHIFRLLDDRLETHMGIRRVISSDRRGGIWEILDDTGTVRYIQLDTEEGEWVEIPL